MPMVGNFLQRIFIMSDVCQTTAELKGSCHSGLQSHMCHIRFILTVSHRMLFKRYPLNHWSVQPKKSFVVEMEIFKYVTL